MIGNLVELPGKKRGNLQNDGVKGGARGNGKKTRGSYILRAGHKFKGKKSKRAEIKEIKETR